MELVETEKRGLRNNSDNDEDENEDARSFDRNINFFNFNKTIREM